MANENNFGYVDGLRNRYETLHDVLSAEVYDYQALKKAWRAYFCGYLYYLGWNKTAVNHLFEWGNTGHNWKLLHWEPLTSEQRLEAMRSLLEEVCYTSDRLSLDRLLRAHHQYNRIQEPEALNEAYGPILSKQQP